MTPASRKKGRAPTRQSGGAVPREKKSERRAPREEPSQVDVQALQTAMEELSAAEEELREQNQALIEARAVIEKERRRYQDLFELAPDPYLVTDTHGVIQEGNRAAGLLLIDS